LLTERTVRFLKESAIFYEEEAKRLLRECDATTYLKKTERRLKEEHDRCTDTISSLTEKKILAVVVKHMITDNIREVMEMESGIRFMLDNDKLDDINLLYRLISRVDANKEVLKTMTCNRLVELGRSINAGLMNTGETTQVDGDPSTSGAAAAKADKAASNATTLAIKWVDEVLALKDKYDRIWEQALMQDKGIQTAMTRAFASFINELKEAAEYISLFIDDNLRRGIKGQPDNEVELVLDKAITLFRYLGDKDLFERHYKNHLSRRLINGRTLSYDAEKQMIGKLKMEVGVAFTTKLEVMFKDMNVSEEMVKEFREYRSAASPSPSSNIDLSVNVLNSVFWPTKVVGQVETKSCTYPPIIESVRQQFSSYYHTRHNGRKLLWKGNMGQAVIKATFKGTRHEITVSTYGMVILLAFNDHASLSYSDLQTLTQIPEEDLIRNLQSLAVVPKTRLLTKTPMSKDVKPTDVFSINDSFSSKFVRFRVGVVAGNKAENDKEKRETADMVEKDRSHQIEASIVRTMKQRKELGHQDLVVEVIGQLRNRFAPDLGSLKKRIESLIERDYLERVEGSRETYRYLVCYYFRISGRFGSVLTMSVGMISMVSGCILWA
jgi:cullin 3